MVGAERFAGQHPPLCDPLLRIANGSPDLPTMDLMNFRPKRNTRQPDEHAAAPTEEPASSGQPMPVNSHSAGWLDSSAELRDGLQVQEDDLDSLPPELRDAFTSP